ncbi:MAG: hypothetical protein ACO3JI_06635, partial [Steroidobacteraceae bacterium]
MRLLRSAPWLATFLFLLAAATARAALPPVESFGTTPIIDNVTLSLDGRFIASSYAGDKVSIVILDRNIKKLTQRVDFDQNLKLRGMNFVNDHVLIAQFSITYTQRGRSEDKAEIGAVFAIDVRDGSSRQLLEAKTNSRIYPSSGGFLSRKGAAPDEILMSALLLENAAAGSSPDEASNSVLSVNPLTGKWRLIEKGSRTTNGWLIDTEGRIVGRTEFNRKEQRRTIRIKDGDDYRIIYEHTDP